MSNPTSPEVFLKMDRRTFGEFADRYIKDENASPPLSPETRAIMESEPVIGRLYHHLHAVRDSIDIQLESDRVAMELELAIDETCKASPEILAEVRQRHLTSMRPRLRFARGLSAALGHVTWLYTFITGTDAVALERNDLLSKLERVREVVDKSRREGLNDPDGTSDREEDLWNDLAFLIGKTPAPEA